MSTQVRGDVLRGRRTTLEMEADAFARAGHRMVDRIADLLRTLPERAVIPGESPDEVRRVLDADRPLPDQGSDPEELLERATVGDRGPDGQVDRRSAGVSGGRRHPHLWW
jgi:hypothetical protein